MTLDEWIIHGETGISSKTMWAAVKGVAAPEEKMKSEAMFDMPHDRDDFGRCYKLYKQCNLTNSDLQKVSDAFPEWKKIVENWDELCRLYNNHFPMYEFLQKLNR